MLNLKWFNRFAFAIVCDLLDSSRRNDIKHAINLLTSTETYDANMSEVATELQTFAQHTSLLALSEITLPFFTFLLTVLQVLSFSWALVLTIKFF